MSDLPRYKCSKIVEGMLIGSMLTNKTAGTVELIEVDYDADPSKEIRRVEVGFDYMDKHNPQIGGYYVRYKDGYESFSPAEAFEEGYTLIKDDGVIYTTDKTPDLTGPRGAAWLVMKEFDTRPTVEAVVDSWIVKASYANPFWSHYIVGVISLRDIPGVPEANKVFPEATHEICVAVLDPEKQPYPLNAAPHMLKPINYAGQWVALNDEEARQTAEDCVKAIINGTLSPDTDFRSEWDKLFKSR